MANQLFIDEFVAKVDEEYCNRTPKSAAIAEDAKKSSPGGDYRSMVWWGPYPLVMDKADGAYLYDVDGNKYLDYASNWTSTILGNTPKEVVDAVNTAMNKEGVAMSAPHAEVYEWARLICDRIKSVEKVRFSCSGSEAGMFALRTARAFTGKDKVIKLEGGFHGSYDPIHFHVGWGPWEKGMPQSLKQDIVMVKANDIAATEKVIRENYQDCCGVIMEPIMAAGGMIPLDKEYVQFMRNITRELGILLIIDEVVTFRLAPGGGQEIYGIDADLSYFGKTLAAGMPNGAFGGRADIMDLYNQADNPAPMFHSGTFIATPAVAAAGVASLKAMGKETLDRINEMGETLAERIRGVLDEKGIKAVLMGMGSLDNLHWREEALRNPDDAEDQVHDLKPIFNKLMMKRGFYVTGRNIFMISTPMGQAEMDATVQAVSETLDEMKPVIQEMAPHLIK